MKYSKGVDFKAKSTIKIGNNESDLNELSIS